MAKKFIDEGKALLKSKTFWFNILFIVVTIASQFGYSDFQPSDKVVETLGMVFALGNILLRLKTTTPITKLK